MTGCVTRRIVALALPLAAALFLCLSAAYAQTGSAASVVSLTGQVSILRDNYPKALNIGDSVQPKQIIVTGPNGWAELRVADGSTIQVFPNSTFTFRQDPSNLKHLLELTIGWVKIHIQKFGNQPNPNDVYTPTAVISVRGTTFDVKVEDDTETFVSVDEGIVDVRNLTVGGPAKTLTNGESIHVFKGQQLAKTVDRGAVAQSAMRAAAQAIYELVFRTARPGGGVPASTGGGTSADSNKPAPPSTAPPTAPTTAPPTAPSSTPPTGP
jgi:hypothetical protein